MTTVKKSIYAKLMTAREQFHQSKITKTGWNDYSKYHYFELSDFLIPAMGIMGHNDLLPICSFETEIATMTIYDVTTEATIVITSPMSTANLKACQPVQSLGAVETFQRRYLWVAALEIVEHDVIEESTGKPEKPAPEPTPEKPAKPAPKPITDKQKIQIGEYVVAGQIPEKTKEWMVGRELSYSQATKVIAVCKKFNKGEDE